MSGLENLINLLVMLTILSVIAERITNVWKLSHDELRKAADDPRVREYRIQGRSIAVGIVVALIIKADLFAVLVRLHDPWITLGWVRSTGNHWFLSPAATGIGPFLISLVGCVFMGIALRFGSKFWHDILGNVFELRRRLKVRTTRLEQPESRD